MKLGGLATLLGAFLTACSLTANLDDLKSGDAGRGSAGSAGSAGAGGSSTVCEPGNCAGCTDCSSFCSCASPKDFDGCFAKCVDAGAGGATGGAGGAASGGAAGAGGSPACTSNADCGMGEFCDEPGCSSSGTCAAIPSACPDVVQPVCGCDGITYTSECEAQLKGVSTASDGPC